MTSRLYAEISIFGLVIFVNYGNEEIKETWRMGSFVRKAFGGDMLEFGYIEREVLHDNVLETLRKMRFIMLLNRANMRPAFAVNHRGGGKVRKEVY